MNYNWDNDDLIVLSGTSNPDLSKQITDSLDVHQGKLDIGRHPDGEIWVHSQSDLRGRDIFVVQSLCPPVNDNLQELLIIIDAAKRASAGRITAVIPYMGYARSDRRDQGSRTSITAKLVAKQIEVAGADRIVTMDLHSAQIQGFFDVPVDHLYAKDIFVPFFRSQFGNDWKKLTVCSPDVGGMKMARAIADRVDARLATVEKRRVDDERVEVGFVLGDVGGRNVLITDDMISTAGTIAQAAHTVADKGAESIKLAATHGLFCGDALAKIQECPADKIYVIDTIPLHEEARSLSDKIEVLSSAHVFADAICKIHCSSPIGRRV